MHSYFFHSDHLGSTSYLTDKSGEVSQHVEYFPFGGVMVDERHWAVENQYLFNGKELDEETGLYYYGARYYDPKMAMWYGVDPLAEKYAFSSPYAYCINNPVILVDPDGRKLIAITIKTESKAIKSNIVLIVDKKIASKVKSLVKYAIDNDINVHFNSSFRSKKQQEEVQKTGLTPAKVGTSRHEGGFGLDFNLYDEKGEIISVNKTVTKENKFIKKAKGLGFRWGGEFRKPDKLHIDAWPAGEEKKYDYDSWSDAYKENQKDYKDKTYEKETYKYDKPEPNKTEKQD